MWNCSQELHPTLTLPSTFLLPTLSLPPTGSREKLPRGAQACVDIPPKPEAVLPEIHDKNHDNSPDLQRSALVVPKPRIAISTLYRLQRRPCVHAPPLFVTEPPSSQQHSSPGADETRLCDFQKSEIEGDKKSSFGGIYFALIRMLSHVGIFF